jgi:hypothetical protein
MFKANDYGAMYNKYNTLIYADEEANTTKALEIRSRSQTYTRFL